MKVAVTGVGGFVGSHLVRELTEHNIEVVGISLPSDDTTQLEHLMSESVHADLTKKWPLSTEVDCVIHLAGLAAVAPSFDQPQKYIEVNSSMITHMGEHYLKFDGQKPRLLIVSSGAIYNPASPMPLDENSEISFSSPYAVSKILIENQVRYYASRGLDCVVARPFNHIGPGQKPGFLLPDLFRDLQTDKNTGILKIGNLKSKRDYTDVRDVVRAYRLLATSGSLAHSLYNICSGRSVSGQEILAKLQQLMNLTDLKIVTDKNRFRPNDAPEIIGDFSRLKTDTGWQPKIDLDTTLKDFINQ